MIVLWSDMCTVAVAKQCTINQNAQSVIQYPYRSVDYVIGANCISCD